jgi:hypothetical protein
MGRVVGQTAGTALPSAARTAVGRATGSAARWSMVWALRSALGMAVGQRAVLGGRWRVERPAAVTVWRGGRDEDERRVLSAESELSAWRLSGGESSVGLSDRRESRVGDWPRRPAGGVAPPRARRHESGSGTSEAQSCRSAPAPRAKVGTRPTVRWLRPACVRPRGVLGRTTSDSGIVCVLDLGGDWTILCAATSGVVAGLRSQDSKPAGPSLCMEAILAR